VSHNSEPTKARYPVAFLSRQETSFFRGLKIADLASRSGDGKYCAKYFLLLLLILITVTCRAYGDVALLIEEPYGFFGSINPTGHSAIYLNRVCAETPTKLRRCRPGETGVVISRYSRIRQVDWVAIPLLPYLYAVENAANIPEYAEQASVEKMRARYAETHLESLSSAVAGYDAKNVWPQLLGVAYIRKIYSFEIITSAEQDDRLIAEYNSTANKSHFNLFTNNCADFSKHLINFYYPHAARRNILADAGITTPKQIAKSLASYSARNEQLELNRIIIPQIPGSYPRSHAPRGVAESLLKTKKYALPIIAINPYFIVGIALTYLTSGRFEFPNNAESVNPINQEQTLLNGGGRVPQETPEADVDSSQVATD
jgi:hypothetical protein